MLPRRRFILRAALPLITAATVGLSLPGAARAGDPGPLCPEIREVKDIYEVEFEVRDPAPVKYLDKKWTPEFQHYRKTAATGRIVAVYKGRKKVGDVAPMKERDNWMSTLVVGDWRKLFAAQKFTLLIGYEGWLGDAGRCNASVCGDYEENKAAMLACLGKQAKKAPGAR